MLDRVTLKNVKFHQGHDGQGLNADIIIDGKKVAHVYDGAYGGCFEYTVLGSVDEQEDGSYKASPEREKNKILFQELEDHIKTLPSKPMVINGEPFMRDGEQVTIKPNLDFIIDDLINEQENEKFKKKMKKAMENSIVVGKIGGTSYHTIGYKKTLAEIVQIPGGKLTIEVRIKKVKRELKEGEEILNDNLEALGLRI